MVIKRYILKEWMISAINFEREINYENILIITLKIKLKIALKD